VKTGTHGGLDVCGKDKVMRKERVRDSERGQVGAEVRVHGDSVGAVTLMSTWGKMTLGPHMDEVFMLPAESFLESSKVGPHKFVGWSFSHGRRGDMVAAEGLRLFPVRPSLLMRL
jgi:hypothetical protein